MRSSRKKIPKEPKESEEAHSNETHQKISRDLNIDLKECRVPQSKGLSVMSPAELEELKGQLKTHLDQGLLGPVPVHGMPLHYLSVRRMDLRVSVLTIVP